MRSRLMFQIILMFLVFLLGSACSVMEPLEEEDPATDDGNREEEPVVTDPGTGMRIAALDYQITDLNDPDALAKYARADLLIVGTWQFWDANLDLSVLRAANPDQKIVAYFRTKCVREEWAQVPAAGTSYQHELYKAAAPYLSRTTAGDTLSDWPGALVFDYTNPAARQAVLDVFVSYQNSSENRFDGVFWDYFAPWLWIPDSVEMDGEPDMDGDGVPHWDDEDEKQAFVDAQDAWVDEMRVALGEDFIQIANGVRACQDSVFASKFDGMFYEIFPNLGFPGSGRFQLALDPEVPNNLFAARQWPRTRNGGPWLILSNMHPVGTYVDSDGNPQILDADDFTRIIALLTDNTAITYAGSGARDAGIPSVEYNLGSPVGGMQVEGDVYRREFQHGSVELYMGSGDFPLPFEFQVIQDGKVIHDMDLPTIER